MNQQEPHRQGQSVLEYQQDSVSPIYKRGISAHFGCWEVSRPPPFSLSFTSSYGMTRFLFLVGLEKGPNQAICTQGGDISSLLLPYCGKNS